MSDWSRHVYPHGEFVQLHERLWSCEGSLPRLPIPRNMYVYRLESGGLLVFNGVAMNVEQMEQLDALGTVELIVAPSYFHRMQARAYLERYPQAKVVCPAGAREHVAKEVTVHDTSEALLPKHGVKASTPDGVTPREGLLECPLGDDGVALLFCDALFNLPHGHGLGGFMMRLIGSTGFFGATRIAKTFLIKDRKAYKAWLEAQAARDDVRLIGVAHGATIREDCAARLAEAAARL